MTNHWTVRVNETDYHMSTRPDPTPDTPTLGVESFAAKIVAKPAVYGAEVWALAHAYEAQRERITDLEDDVERLRPREAFVPEVLFEHDGLCIETECCGGLSVATRDDDEQPWHVVTDKEQSHQLTTALAKWAGLDGVEWNFIGPMSRPIGDVLLTNGSAVSVGFCHHDGVWNCMFPGQPTHWAPLPKPPEAT